MTSREWFGDQTRLAVENFAVSGERVDARVIRALAALKAEAARANGDLDEVEAVDAVRAAAIVAAAESIVAGDHADQFPVDVFQTGSGTSTNMNLNEVIANLATDSSGRPVHPNDHVNASQSSNDTFVSAVHVAVALALRDELDPAVSSLETELRTRAHDLRDVVKPGRTHHMDAVPVTLGQELAGMATQVGDARARIGRAGAGVHRLALGGTAVGSGLNAPASFAGAVIGGLASRFDLPFVEAPDHFAANASRDDLVDVSAQLRGLAVVLVKIGNDLRLMASGPATGFAEIELPELQPGSSQMPGKVNPVIVESATQVAARVLGNDACVAFAGSQGTLELNVYTPLIGQSVLSSISLLAAVCQLLGERCIAGLRADVDRCRRLAESSPALATALTPLLGYDRAAEVVKSALRRGVTVRTEVLDRGLLSEAVVDEVLDVAAMAAGGLRET